MISNKILNCAATRIALDDENDLVSEHICNIELELSVNFKGDVDKKQLISKLKSELSASISASMNIVARDLNLKPINLEVKPVLVECNEK
ncbi:MAG TPA: hypothetical protein ENI61_03280 [Ignavibacteria bacterium]|nr:hypothetical protein [Ignavibacteria bacterium]